MTTTTRANDLISELLADGFRPGPPRHLRADCLMDDLDTYSSLECEACGHGHHTVTPITVAASIGWCACAVSAAARWRCRPASPDPGA